MSAALSRSGGGESVMGELAIGDAGGEGLERQSTQAVKRVVLDVALIEPEGGLMKVATQVLCRALVPHPHQAAAEQRPHGFSSIHVDVVGAHILASTVVHTAVVEALGFDALIAGVLIATDCCTLLHVLADRGLQQLFAGGRDRHGHGMAAPLSHAQHRLLAGCSTATTAPLVVMLVALLAAHVELIDFHHALQHGQVLATGLPDPLQQEPGGPLHYPDLLGQLHRGNSLTGSDHQVHGIEPLVQGHMGALKDGLGAYRELLTTRAAAIVTAPFAAPGDDLV